MIDMLDVTKREVDKIDMIDVIDAINVFCCQETTKAHRSSTSSTRRCRSRRARACLRREGFENCERTQQRPPRHSAKGIGRGGGVERPKIGNDLVAGEHTHTHTRMHARAHQTRGVRRVPGMVDSKYV